MNKLSAFFNVVFIIAICIIVMKYENKIERIYISNAQNYNVYAQTKFDRDLYHMTWLRTVEITHGYLKFVNYTAKDTLTILSDSSQYYLKNSQKIFSEAVMKFDIQTDSLLSTKRYFKNFKY